MKNRWVSTTSGGEDKALLVEKYRKYIRKGKIQIKILCNNLEQIESFYEKWLNSSSSEPGDEESLSESLNDPLGEREQLRKARKITAVLKANIEQCKEKLRVVNEQTNVRGRTCFPIPTISTFSGNFTEWSSFWYTFETYMDKGNNLYKIQEFIATNESVRKLYDYCCQL